MDEPAPPPSSPPTRARDDAQLRARERTAELTTMLEWLRAEEAASRRAAAEARRRSEQLARFEAALLRLVTMPHESLETILREVTEVSARTLEVERVAVWLFNPARTELRCRGRYRPSDGAHEEELVLRASEFPRYLAALEERITIAAADAATDERTRELVEAFASLVAVRALLAVPIRIGSKVVGVLSHLETHDRRDWVQEEQDFASAVAGIVALALAAEQRRATEAQLHALAAHLEEVREDERAGLARELHDELGQTLTAIRMDAAWLGRALHGPPERLHARGPERIDSMKTLLDEAVRTVQRISSELRPGALEELGLVTALRGLAEKFAERSGLRVHFTTPESLPGSVDREGVVLYRAMQEALTNVARHAEASEITASLCCEAGRLRLEVHDNGRGLPPEMLSHPKSFGLLGMRERAAALGGEVSFESAPQQGTTVCVVLPYAGG